MSTFTWQVVATFAAVVGATIIGWKQVGIAKGQSETARAAMEVAKAQALTARLAQRGNLFDKRFEVYQAVRGYLSVAISQGGWKALADQHATISDALTKARFLFPETVTKMINQALSLADEYSDLAAEIPLFPELDDKDARKAKLREKRSEVRTAITSLADRMGEEMKVFAE